MKSVDEPASDGEPRRPRTQLAVRILEFSARILIAFGIGCLLLAAYLLWQGKVVGHDVARAQGEVVGYFENREGDKTTYRPSIRFTTENGSIVTTTSQLAAESKRFDIGARVPVIYEREKPSDIRLALFFDNWLPPLIAALVGVVGMAGGILVRRSLRRELAKVRPGA